MGDRRVTAQPSGDNVDVAGYIEKPRVGDGVPRGMSGYHHWLFVADLGDGDQDEGEDGNVSEDRR
jgi:hypothetical protein